MNDKKEFSTIKIYSPTAKRLKSFIKKGGGTIAGWASVVLDEAMKQEKTDKRLMKEAKKKGEFISWETVKAHLNNVHGND